MARSRRVATGVCVFVLCCAGANPAWAQRESGPFAGLFSAGRPGDVDRALSLDFSGYAGYDDTVREQSSQTTEDPRFQTSGEFGGMSLGLRYNQSSQRNTFGVSATTSLRQYGARPDEISPTYSASTNLDIAIGRHLSVHGMFGGSYSSFYQFAPFLQANPVAPPPDEPAIQPAVYGMALVSQWNLATFASAGISANLSQRLTFSVDGSLQHTTFDSDQTSALTARAFSFRLQNHLTRDFGFHAGYGFQDGSFGNAPTLQPSVQLHNLDIGLDFNHALSVTRRTRLAFGSGSSMAESSLDNGVRRYQITGQASLTRDIKRTWSSSLTYVRGSQFVAGITDVIFSDTVTANVGGQLATRVQLSGSAAYSSGMFGLSNTGPRFGTYTGTGSLTVGLTRTLGVYVQYLYYRYDIPPDSAATNLAAPGRLNRHSVTIGVHGSLPIVKGVRQRRDSR